MAREIGPDRFKSVLELEFERTTSWCKLERLQESLVGRTRLVSWVKSKILEEIGYHSMKKEHKELRQPPHP